MIPAGQVPGAVDQLCPGLVAHPAWQWVCGAGGSRLAGSRSPAAGQVGGGPHSLLSGGRQYLLIDTDLHMGVWPQMEQRMSFWDTLLQGWAEELIPSVVVV